jgi:hypothetical protein
MAHQVLDPLDHGPVGHMQLWELSWQCQAVVDVNPHNHLVFSPAVPLVGDDGCDVRDQTLGLKLEIVGADQDQALPRPPQHVEDLE